MVVSLDHRGHPSSSFESKRQRSHLEVLLYQEKFCCIRAVIKCFYRCFEIWMWDYVASEILATSAKLALRHLPRAAQVPWAAL